MYIELISKITRIIIRVAYRPLKQYEKYDITLYEDFKSSLKQSNNYRRFEQLQP